MSHLLPLISVSQLFSSHLAGCHWDPKPILHSGFATACSKQTFKVSRVFYQASTFSVLQVTSWWLSFGVKCRVFYEKASGSRHPNRCGTGLADLVSPTADGSGGRDRAVDLCLISRTSWVQCSLFMSAKFQVWNYFLSTIEDAAVRRGKLGWFTLRECYTNSGNAHKGHEKQTSIRRRNMKISFSICPALYYYSKCIQPIIPSDCFIISKL